jgi:hypothetical protein
MKSFMGLSLFIIGLISALLGLAIIVRDRLVLKSARTKALGIEEKKTLLDSITALINALANFAEKLFGQFTLKEKLPVFLIVMGAAVCVLGWWLIR